jgi:hypothetical protein
MTDEATGRASASYGSASHAAIINGKDSRKADAVLAPNQNIENNPMQSSMCRWHGCFERSRENILTRRANQRHYCIIAQFAKPHMALPNGLAGATTGQKSRQLKLHRLATQHGRVGSRVRP